MLTFTRADGLCELYVDGTLVANKNITDQVAPNVPNILIQNHMYFDNLRLYNRKLKSNEISEIYNSEK